MCTLGSPVRWAIAALESLVKEGSIHSLPSAHAVNSHRHLELDHREFLLRNRYPIMNFRKTIIF